jgi:hypothetical protein
MKLQAWGLELDDRIHGVLFACKPHGAVANAFATAWSDIDSRKAPVGPPRGASDVPRPPSSTAASRPSRRLLTPFGRSASQLA